MTPQISISEMQNLLRTMISYQATLTSVIIAVYLFLIPRWDKKLDEESNRIVPPDNPSARAEKVRVIKQINGLLVLGEVPLYVLLLLPILESFAYLFIGLPDPNLLYAVGAAFFITIWFFVLNPLTTR